MGSFKMYDRGSFIHTPSDCNRGSGKSIGRRETGVEQESPAQFFRLNSIDAFAPGKKDLTEANRNSFNQLLGKDDLNRSSFNSISDFSQVITINKTLFDNTDVAKQLENDGILTDNAESMAKAVLSIEKRLRYFDSDLIEEMEILNYNLILVDSAFMGNYDSFITALEMIEEYYSDPKY